MIDNIGAYKELDAQGVEVVPVRFKNRTALLSPDGVLALDSSKITSEADEKAVLLEEIGHFCTHAFYQPDAPNAVWEKQEYKALRYIFEKYYPPSLLAGLMRRGLSEPWQMAEELALPQSFVEQMLIFYRDVRAIDFNHIDAPEHAPTGADAAPHPAEEAESAASATPTLEELLGAAMELYLAAQPRRDDWQERGEELHAWYQEQFG